MQIPCHWQETQPHSSFYGGSSGSYECSDPSSTIFPEPKDRNYVVDTAVAAGHSILCCFSVF